ncbi:E3 ubiquitin-protein ligase TTC3 [Pelobates fuscus]|uniref:E3 ubiquitin-protein ligase TTC3 n=1 Tax=Pelobates fuscus TaxID=191477 RepID=UPI002FE4ACCA
MDGLTETKAYEMCTSAYRRTTCLLGHDSFVEFQPLYEKVDPVTFWLSHPIHIIRGNCDVVKIYMVWPILIKQIDYMKYIPNRLADYSDMSIKELNFIELLEDLADLVKKVADDRLAIEGILRIGTKLRAGRTRKLLAEALNWVQATGDKVLHNKLQEQENISSPALPAFFIDYALYISRMAEEGLTLVSVFKNQSCPTCSEVAETMKILGNNAFTNEQFNLAVENYSKAIQYSPNNHLLFSNRSLCFTRMGKFGKALADGKKAVILKQKWPKGHYRFCEALFLIGERERALASNEKAQELCKDSPDGIRDLIQQHAKFKTQIEEIKEQKLRKKSFKKQMQEKKLAALFSSTLEKENRKLLSYVKEDAIVKEPVNVNVTENKECPEITGQNHKKGKSKAKGVDCEKLKEAHSKPDSNGTPINESCKASQMDLPSLEDFVKSQVHEGCTALENQRCHSALGIFSRLLDILGETDFKKLHLNNIDCAVLEYGHANALLGTGQCHELTKAEEQFKRIQTQYTKERFSCLAVYGIGNVYFRQNRFSDALKQYVKSQTMVAHKIVPGVLNWPLTDVVINESIPEKLKLILENRIEECKFPPSPDAICRFEKCLSVPKIQIYFTDPDFKGFIRMWCSLLCKVEFHICCWKKLKASAYSDKIDKDFLKNACLTPDCKGRICHIVIYDSTGVVKCEFEDKIVRKKEPPRATSKQKTNSNKKFKMKPENKAEHKKISQEDIVMLPGNEIYKNSMRTCCRFDLKAIDNHNEIMLMQIAQKKVVIRYGLCDTKEFQDLLVLWNVISSEELEAFSFQTSCQCGHEEMTLLLQHLFEMNNRVKTRIFLFCLEKCGHSVTLDLLEWLFIVDEAGFEAAENFHIMYLELLNNLNLESVINPWNETYGKYLNFPLKESTMEKVIAKLHEAELFRFFIWFLDENRGTITYRGLEEVLDIYFTDMDAPYYNFRAKSTNENNSTKCIKVKNKHKKKKQNQTKTVYTYSGGVSTRPQEEDIFTEENTLSLLNPHEPFLVPDFLRHQIEEFETIYEPDFGLSRFHRPDIQTADVVRETLYDYFSQILDEHGPLEVDNQLLVGEYNGFPDDTHRLVEESGGLKKFLLESNRFAMVGDLLGLPMQAALLESDVVGPTLNPTAQEFSPTANKPCSEIFHTNNTSTIPYYPYSTIAINSPTALPSDLLTNNAPLPYSLLDTNHGSVPLMTMGTTVIPDQSIGLIPAMNVDLCYINVGSTGSYNLSRPETVQQTNIQVNQESSYVKPWNITDLSPQKNNLQSVTPRNKQTAIVAVQVDIETAEHDVNTDPYQPYETQQGDILRMEKELIVVREHMKEATDKYDHLDSRYQEEITGFSKQIHEAIETNKIAKKEFEWLNQESEIEAKKWQQEKKENQDKIRAIKNNNKVVTETNERYSREIEEKKKQYEKYLDNFLHICVGNFEKERSMLEERIKQLQEELEEIHARAVAAEVNVLENRKQSELLKLRSKSTKAESHMHQLKAMAISHQNSAETRKQMSNLESFLSTVAPETENITSKFDEKIKLVKSGTKLCNVIEIPASSMQPVLQSQSSTQASSTPSAHSSPSPPASLKSPKKNKTVTKITPSKEAMKVPSVPPGAIKPKVQKPASAVERGAFGKEKRDQLPPETRHLSPAKQTPFDRIIVELQEIFPHYKSGELAVFIKEVRSRIGGTLSGMNKDEIIARVTEYILDHQAKCGSSTNQAATVGIVPKPVQPGPQPAPAAQSKAPWRVVTSSSKNKFQKSNKCEFPSDEPCIICHDELRQYPLHMLDCGHCFHKHCITKWLHTQSTCPTCRDHALLPEDFPALSGRLRTA